MKRLATSSVQSGSRELTGSRLSYKTSKPTPSDLLPPMRLCLQKFCKLPKWCPPGEKPSIPYLWSYDELSCLNHNRSEVSSRPSPEVRCLRPLPFLCYLSGHLFLLRISSGAPPCCPLQARAPGVSIPLCSFDSLTLAGLP